MPFHIYEVIKLPLSINHQYEFYTSLSTEISAIAFNRDVNYFLQITGANNRPHGSVRHVTHSSDLFVECIKSTCSRGLVQGDVTEVKAHCRYSVHRAPYPRGVLRLYENTFLFINTTTLQVQCLKTVFQNDTVLLDLVEHALL